MTRSPVCQCENPLQNTAAGGSSILPLALELVCIHSLFNCLYCNIFLSSRRPLKSSGCRTATHIHFSLMCMAMEWCCLSWWLELCLIPTSTTEIRFHFSSLLYLFIYFAQHHPLKECITFSWFLFWFFANHSLATSELGICLFCFFNSHASMLACKLIGRTRGGYYEARSNADINQAEWPNTNHVVFSHSHRSSFIHFYDSGVTEQNQNSDTSQPHEWLHKDFFCHVNRLLSK